MMIQMQLQTYLDEMSLKANDQLTLKALMHPFGLAVTLDEEDEGLVVGLILEDLYENFSAKATIDPIDVAVSAWGLGYNQAGPFLDAVPYMIYQCMKEEKDLFSAVS